MDGLMVVEQSQYKVPRCTNCSSYLNGFCSLNEHSWTCSVCGTHVDLPDDKFPNLPSFVTSLPSYQIMDRSVSFNLNHVIIIGSGDISPARAIMQSLPSDSPVQVFVVNTPETARKLVTTAENYEQLSKLPSTSVKIPVSNTIPILTTLLNSKRSCFWCRVFCSGGNLDDKAIQKLSVFTHIPIRIDFFIDSPIHTSSLQRFTTSVPGVCRFFSSFDSHSSLSRVSDIASSDCWRPFGFQCKVNVKSGFYKASCVHQRPTLPVIASSRACVPFVITPPPEDRKLGFQAIQTIAHVHIWEPPTNTLWKVTNVINNDFPVSSNVDEIIYSASASALFDYYCRHNQLNMIDKVKPNTPNMKALIDMRDCMLQQDKHNFDLFSLTFFELCPPLTWRFVLGAFVETWKAKGSEESEVIIIKQFPKVKYALREGVDLLVGDAIKNYVDLCKPLDVCVEQDTMEHLKTELPKKAKK
ncbi:Sec23/Sec24 zinc finger-containing protein [Histomonas meleagridis]|uniref:Sec23/Sec24 zinc finger-containing protein n=1 Tax=Histomonas meleagridis TaxID=135588 RepID=UPI00355A5C09|nr:Sec23/Sec24 zinc finger-containing protein [Histomonas meleagridis]KAH0801438.1 Sec23/Sec24 zinc finger-containing protein [Histomonas meleagridis]